MSTTIDSLSIEIQSNSTGAAQGIDALAASLGKLKSNGTISVAVKNLNNLTTALKNMTSVASNASKISSLADAMVKLKSVGSTGTGVKKLAESLNSLKGVDFTVLSRVADSSAMFERVAGSLGQLSAVKSGGISTLVNSLSKLDQVTDSLDEGSISRFAQRVERLNEVLGPLAMKCTSIKGAFSAINMGAKTAAGGVKTLHTEVKVGVLNMSNLIIVMQGVVNALRPVVQLLARVIGDALEWDGVSARFGRGFGAQAEETYAWIQRLNKEMGINVQQFMQYSSVFSTMLQGFGVGTRDAGKMALGYTELIYDIWAGYNDVYKNFSDAADAVKSAIAGEVEPIRRAGFTIVESTLEQTAANYGLEISLENATEAQKSYLRYLTLVNQAHAQNLVGTYAREMNTAEGMVRTFTQQLKSLAQSFGSLFLPVLVKVMPWLQAFVDLLTEAVIAVASFFGVDIQPIDWSGFGGGSSSLEGVGDAADNAADSLGGTADGVNGVTDAIKDLKKATIGIDELNVISPPDTNTSGSGSGSGAGSGTGGGLGAFEGLDVDSLWDDSVFDQIQSKVDAIKDKLKEWLPIIEIIGGALAGLGIATLLKNFGDALEKMNLLQKLLATVAIVAIEAVLVFTFADNYLESGNLLNLIGEAVATAIGSYLLYRTWGVKGLVLGIAVSLAMQLAAITLNLADGGVSMDDPELWIQSAFTTAMGAVGGGLIVKKAFSTMPNGLGKGALFGALATLSLTLAAITIGNAADGDLGLTEAITGVLSTALGGAAGAALCTFLGIATGGTGFLIGAAIMLAVNVIGAVVATKAGLKEKMAADIAEVFAGSGEFALEDVSVEISVKLSAITNDFGDFEQYRGVIDDTKKSIANVTGEIDKMGEAIGRGSGSFEEYVPKIISSLTTLETEAKTKLEAIRDSLIEALAGGLGDGYHNLGDYIVTVNKVIDDSMAQLDRLEVVLKDTSKMGTAEWTKAWEEYKVLIGEATTATDDFSAKVGSIDWSALTAKDGTLDSGALKTYFSDISTAMGDTKKQIETYYGGIDSDLRALRENAVKLYGEGSDPVVKLDSLIDTNKANWDSALGEVNTIAQSAFDSLQRDVIYKASDVVAKAQENYKNMSWWEKLMYPSEEAYVLEMLSNFQSDYINPIATEMSGVFEELGIDGSVWSSDAMKAITNGLFDVKYVGSDGGWTQTVYKYKDSVAGAIITALKGAGQDAKPFALQVAASVGLDLSNGLGDQYSLIYDETTGAVTGIKDAVNNTTVTMTPDLKASMEELGIDMSDGVVKGADDGMKANKKSWLDWAVWPWNWFKEKNEINSPSKLFERGGKHLVEGLKKGLSLTAIRDKLSDMWDTAKKWWDGKKDLGVAKVAVSLVKSGWSTVKGWIGKIPGVSQAVSLAKSGWSKVSSWIGSMPTLKAKIGLVKSGWTSIKKWLGDLSYKLSFKLPKIGVNWGTKEVLGFKISYPKSFYTYAKGGFPDIGEMFIAREAGPEMVGRIGNRSTVANNDQIVEGISEGVYAAVLAAMRASEGNNSQSVNVYLDGRQITAAVERRQSERGASIMGNQVYGFG